jgi:hypothetical protein
MQKTMKKDPLAVLIAVLIFFTLSMDSIPLPIRAQIIPLASVLALFFMPWALIHSRITPLMKRVLAFVSFAVVYSIIAVFVDVSITGDYDIRLYSFWRQFLALLASVSVFLVSRRALLHISDRFLTIGVLAGAFPAIAIALMNVLWSITGNNVVGRLITWVRSSLQLYTDPFRATGLSLEPSTFAFYLGVIVLPIALALLRTKKVGWPSFGFFIFTLIAFLWTFSGTGFLVLASMLMGGILIISNISVLIRWTIPP